MLKEHRSKIVALIILLLFLVVVFLLVKSYLFPTVVSDADSVLVNKEGNLGYYSLDGEKVDFDNYQDKVRVINSWASWSPFSKEELVMLDALAEEYADKGVVFLAINRNEPEGRAQAFLNTLPELNHIQFVLDKDDRLYEAFSGYTMPETVFYDTNGDTIYHKRGALSQQEVREVLDQVTN